MMCGYMETEGVEGGDRIWMKYPKPPHNVRRNKAFMRAHQSIANSLAEEFKKNKKTDPIPEPLKKSLRKLNSTLYHQNNRAVGAVISQWIEDKWHPVAFHSKVLSPMERNYKIYDKEMLTISRMETPLTRSQTNLQNLDRPSKSTVLPTTSET